MIKLLTLLALILQFLAFWMAAPEILGADWLKRTEGVLRKLIKQIPQFILTVVGIATGAMFYHSIKYTFTLILILIIIAFFMIFYKQISIFLDKKIAQPLINKLILNDNFRFSLLKIAALFFTIGFVIQAVLIIIS